MTKSFKPLDGATLSRIIFGGLIFLIYMVILVTLVMFPIPEANRSALDILIGAISAVMGAVAQYYFGSSEGSQQKTNALIKHQKDYIDDINDTNKGE